MENQRGIDGVVDSIGCSSKVGHSIFIMEVSTDFLAPLSPESKAVDDGGRRWMAAVYDGQRQRCFLLISIVMV
ncbi:hypothetical protein L1987_50246 [Smallanthus sonchifolius]|uniref:Uncharacterized protein n=1 Tax=Smallanthus sonchifolius TaxID=185202 RepID=A0ACB9ELY8_9ASTR|nr:hypothetical protein L1987_50246 [Smallanthus sonchifolius]